MSKNKSGSKKAGKEGIKVKLRKSKRILEQNIVLVECEIDIIGEAEDKFCKEKAIIVADIESKVKEVKVLIDLYKDKLLKKLNDAFEKNLIDIRTLKANLEEKLEYYKADLDKCENAFKKTDSKALVSEKKVLQMLYESLDNTQHIKTSVKLSKVTFDCGKSMQSEKFMRELIGRLETTFETLNEFNNKTERLATFECPFKEVTAMSWNRLTDEALWVCFGANKELVTYDEVGNRLQHIDIDYRIDDILVLHDETILVTSPDSFCIKRIENYIGDGKKRSKTIVESDVYLHGLTFCVDGSKFAVCATNTPNYSKLKPSATLIIEYSQQGEELKRITLRNVNGKVYRISQNTDLNYVLTFPKDGRVYSITPTGEVHGFFSKSQALKASQDPADTGFWPSGVCCNTKGNIFVSDWRGKRVIVLDAHCKFLRYVGEIYKNPNALAICSKMDKLLVGDQGVIEIWQT